MLTSAAGYKLCGLGVGWARHEAKRGVSVVKRSGVRIRQKKFLEREGKPISVTMTKRCSMHRLGCLRDFGIFHRVEEGVLTEYLRVRVGVEGDFETANAENLYVVRGKLYIFSRGDVAGNL